MMIEAQIMGPWADNEPRVLTEYTLDYYEDVTGQPGENVPPAPNVFVHKIRCADDVFVQIEADETYTVLTSTPIPD